MILNLPKGIGKTEFTIKQIERNNKMNYNQAKEIFERCRNKARGARLSGRGTRLVKHGMGYGIQYHNTIVVAIMPNNTYILNSGGYRTNTTKDRINEYSPVKVYQHKFIWYAETNGNTIPFKDGMIIKG